MAQKKGKQKGSVVPGSTGDTSTSSTPACGELTRAMLEEMRRRFDAEGATHEQALSEVSVWLVVQGVVLGTLLSFAHATCCQAPIAIAPAIRLIASLFAFGLSACATYHLRQFFFGRDFQQLGCPKAWLQYLQPHERGDPELVFLSDLAEKYAEAAADRSNQNRVFLKDKLSAKTWVAWSFLFAVVATVANAFCSEVKDHG